MAGRARPPAARRRPLRGIRNAYPTEEAALLYTRAGLSVLPIRGGGSNRRQPFAWAAAGPPQDGWVPGAFSGSAAEVSPWSCARRAFQRRCQSRREGLNKVCGTWPFAVAGAGGDFLPVNFFFIVGLRDWVVATR
jgi:hypothetical protein